MNNPAIYNAALIGAVTGINERWNTSGSQSNYDAMYLAAQNLATAVDALIPAGSFNSCQTALLRGIVQSTFASRFPSTSQDFSQVAQAIVACYNDGNPDLATCTNTDAVELDPIDLNFHSLSNQSLFVPQPPALLTTNDDFSNPSLARFTFLTEGVLGTPSIAANQFTIVSTAPGDKNTGVVEGTEFGMPQGMIVINIVSRAGNAGNTYENIGVGMTKDSNNFVLALWRRIDNLASIQVKIGGVANFRADVSSAGWVPPFEIGLSIVANSLTFWRRIPGGAWTKVTSYDVSGTINFKTVGNMTGWKGCFWVATQAAQTLTMVFSGFKIGYFGSCSIRDTVVVCNNDGSPRITGNNLILSATCCDPQAAAYSAMFQLNLSTYVMTQVGVIMINRGGAIQNDNASQVIAYDNGTFDFFITTWGNAGGAANTIQILYKNVVGQNLLAGAVVVAGMAQLNLNLPVNAGAYDPYAVKIGNTWNLAYTIGPATPSTFYPALSTSNDLVTWTLVGSDPTAFPYEGTRIVSLGGSYWLLCANVAGSNVYDLSMVLKGRSDTLAVTGTYPAHPMLMASGNYTYQVTFDDTVFAGAAANTLGNFRLLRARRYGVNKS